jgi:hypothetical protein
MKRAMIAVLALAVVCTAHAEELGLFTGEAEVPLGNLNLTAARAKALKLALAGAVENALSPVATPEELAARKAEIKSQILAEPDRFVVTYTVLADEARDEKYYLQLEARVRLDEVRAAVRGLKGPPKAAARQSSLLVAPFRARAGGYAYAPEMAAPLRERFTASGHALADERAAEKLIGAPSFATAIRDGRFEELARAAVALDLPMLLLVELLDETPAEARDFECDQRATVKIVDATAPALLGSFTYRFPADAPCGTARDTAARELHAAAVKSLGAHGKLAAAGAAEIVVEVLGVSGFDRLQAVQRLIKGRAYVEQVTLISFARGGVVRFAVYYAGAPDKLTADLASAKGEDFVLKPTGRQGNLWQYSLESR